MPYTDAHTTAVRRARAELARRPVYLDTETTGLGGSDEIVEICVLDDEGNVLIDSLVKPMGRIPPDVIRIHGITDRMVAGAPTWLELWPQVEAALSGRRVAIYNAEFDLRMMRQSHRVHRLAWGLPDDGFFCLMHLYAQYCGGSRWRSLEQARRECRLGLPNAHRARADALLARVVLRFMAGE